MASSAPRTLADHLRGWSDEQLATLLTHRPDLGVPVPRDSAQLAARVVVRRSVERALANADTLTLVVAEALANIGPATVAELTAVVNASPEAVAGALTSLEEQALVWGAPGPLRSVTALTELLRRDGGADPAQVPALLDAVSPAAKAILDRLDLRGEEGKVAAIPARLTPDSAAAPTEELLTRGLLVATGPRTVAVPWTVRLALHQGTSTGVAVDEAPRIATSPREEASVNRTGAGAALDLVRHVQVLADAWGIDPPPQLRSGGLGVREFRAAATLLKVEPAEAALIIETAAAAGLIAVGMTDDVDAAWLPTHEYDAWVDDPPAQRWQRLAHAWYTSARQVSLIGERIGNKPVNALAADLEQPWLVELKAQVLQEVCTLPPGQVLAPGTGLPSLEERLRWRRPRVPRTVHDHVHEALTEAAIIGVVALGAITTPGQALIAGEDAAAALAPLLPIPLDHVLIQADLTAVAPGPLESHLESRLAMVADIESRGHATVYRFSDSSIRRAFDSGWATAEVHDFLTNTSQTPVPQALRYLVDDVARRFGTMRVGHAESFLRSDDETALAELLHHPRAASLRLRRIAPTVVISDVPLGVLLPRLRELGAAPVVESPDGSVSIAGVEALRARTPRRDQPSAGRDLARSIAHINNVIRGIRSGDRTVRRTRKSAATSPADVIAVLRSCVESGDQVVIGYVGNDGSATERIVVPQRVDGGRLTAYDDRSGDVGTFAIHRITAAVGIDSGDL